MDSMFKNCISLNYINFSNFDTSRVTTMDELFMNCSSIDSIIFPFLNTVSLQSMKSMFQNCYNLSNINLSYFNTSNVKNMSYMFQSCSKLESLNLSSLKIDSVIEMANMFENCSNLKTVEFFKVQAQNLKNMSCLFHSCINLISIDLSYLNPVNVNYIDNMFNNCSGIAFINISNFIASNSESTINMFKDCKNLTSLDLSDLNTSNVKTMNSMFSGCSKLNELNLANFDTSKVTIMSEMFSGCELLNFIELKNFNTSKVNTMKKMFYNCSNLQSLNLTNFNTSSITDASYLFSGCSKISTLNILNFNTSKINYMNNMFENCSELKSLDLSNFDTSSVSNMSYMFAGCEKLNILDLSNFNTINCNNMKGMFINCSILEFINLSNFNTYKVTNMESMFSGCNKLFYLDLSNFSFAIVSNIKYMFKDCNTLKYLNLGSSGNKSSLLYDNLFYNVFIDINICARDQSLQEIVLSFLLKVNCSNYCFSENSKYLISEKICVEDCLKNEFYKYEYNQTCMERCPNGTHSSNINEYLCEEDEKFESDSQIINLSEYIEIIPIGYYFDFEDSKYKPCYRECYSCNMSGDMYIHNCIDYLIDVYLDEFRSKVIPYNITEIDNGYDYLETKENVIFTLTSTYNQKYNKYINISSIDLSECESKIIDEYKILNNTNIYILKVDIFLPGAMAPKVEYELYHPLNGTNLTLLNMSICEDTKAYIYLPTNISYEELYKHNPKSDYYNDICKTHTTESGTDIILKDRRNEFIDDNMNICEEDCELINMDEYYNSTRKVKCSCSTKTIFPKLSEIKIDTKKLLANFKNIKNMINFNLLKCIHLLFNLNNITKNYANYMLVFLLALSIISIFVWTYNNYIKIKTIVKAIITQKKNINKEKYKKNQIETEKENKEEKIEENKDENKEENQYEDIIDTKVDKCIYIKIQSIMNKRIKKIDKKLNKEKDVDILESKYKIKIKKESNKNPNSPTRKMKLKKTDNTKNILIKNNYSRNTTLGSKEKITFNDNEMNLFDYKKAKKNDKRTYIQYYISLLKTKHLLFFTFFNSQDYNSRIIKIYIFFFTIQIEYTINTMFYTDETMHKIYKDEGYFDFIYQIPQMIYSSLLSLILNNLLNNLGLYEDNILELKNSKYKKAKKLKIINIIKAKIILFFIISYILLFSSWVYVGCFCAVYKNTQVHLLIEVLSSFGLSFFISLFTYLIPGIFRIPSLKDGKKGNKLLLYKFSKFIQYIL